MIMYGLIIKLYRLSDASTPGISWCNVEEGVLLFDPGNDQENQRQRHGLMLLRSHCSFRFGFLKVRTQQQKGGLYALALVQVVGLFVEQESNTRCRKSVLDTGPLSTMSRASAGRLF